MTNLRSVLRRVPSIARRDALIADLKAQRAQLRDQRNAARRATESANRRAYEASGRAAVAEQRASAAEKRLQDPQTADTSQTPSWQRKLAENSRLLRAINQWGVRDPVWTINDKKSGYAFAHSYGLDTPALIAEYSDFSAIDWDSLPDAFVVKSVHGAGSHGVLALERHGGRVLDLLDVRQGPIEVSEVVEYLDAKHAAGKCSRNVVIEELLRSPYDGQRIAPDLKLYCFYGMVGMILIRDVNGSRNPRDFRVRFIDPDGSDLGEAILGRGVDPTLPAPLHLDEVVAAGTRLSAAVPAPFVRVDLYERPDRIVFGEISPGAGGNQTMRPDLDFRFGEMWEDAEARLRAEAIRTTALSVQHGTAAVG